MENALTDIGSATLTQLRDWIGNLRQSNGSTATPALNLVEANGRGFFSYTQIAKSVLENTLVEAAYMFVHTNGKLTHQKIQHIENSHQAFAFISGTGFEMMIEQYALDYDADKIRTGFYEKFHIKAA